MMFPEAVLSDYFTITETQSIYYDNTYNNATYYDKTCCRNGISRFIQNHKPINYQQTKYLQQVVLL